MNFSPLPSDPFVGLRPFRSDESLLFFGRRKQALELLQRLHETRFLSVVGSSGSGKSSLVRAGLIPKLQAGFLVEDRDQWSFAIMNPGDHPIRGLATAVLAAISAETGAAGEAEFIAAIRAHGREAILERVASFLEKSDANFLLLVDQFEELFRFGLHRGSAEQRDGANDFVSIILGLAEQRVLPLYVVITMRSDFLGDCDAFYGLPEAMSRSQYLVPRLTRPQRQEAIEGPIRLHGKMIAPRLVDRVLNDVGEEPDQLPVLQHALMRTWENWRQNNHGPIDVPHYEAIGTIKNALSWDADAALEEMDPGDKKLTEQVFQALTDTDAGNRRIRRPAHLSTIQAITGASREKILGIVERFQSGGRSFLVTSSDKTADDPLLDISHESLIRQWKTLRQWVDKEAESRAIYLRLADAALRHKIGRAGLWRDPDLQLALEWRDECHPNTAWASRYHAEYERAMAFLDESRANREAETAAKEQQRIERERQRAEEQARTAKRRLRLAIGTAAMLGLTILAWSLQQQARRSEKIAEARQLAGLAIRTNYEAYQADLRGAGAEATRLWTQARNYLRRARDLEQRATAYLTVSSEPEAYIFVNEEPRTKVGESGKTAVLELEAGEYKLKAVKEAFSPATSQITLVPGNTLVDLKLTAIVFSPEFLDQFLEGKKYWSAPESWVVEKGKMLVTGPGIGFIANRLYQNFRVSFDVQLVNRKGAVWILRAKDELNYYLFQLLGPDANPPNAFRTSIFKNGKPELANTVPVPQDLGRRGDWFRIKVEATEGLIIHLIEVASQPRPEGAHRLASLEDSSFSYGAIGFGTREGEEFSLGPITIVPLKSN